MGYLHFYRILLEEADWRLAQALRTLASPAALPVLVHCIHGKDRTGLVAALLLRLLGVDRETVVRDYAVSESLLRDGRENRRLLGIEGE
jgi:protein tyrosine/serine phosphatase